MSEKTRNDTAAATPARPAARAVAAGRPKAASPAGRLFVRVALLAIFGALATALSAGAALAQSGGGGFDPNALSTNLIGYVGGFVLLIGVIVLAKCLWNNQTVPGIVAFLVCGLFAAVCQGPEVMTSAGSWLLEQAGLSGGGG